MVMEDDLMSVMQSAMRDMKAMSMSGDFDLDFAKMMKMHHQAAVDMSQIVLAKGDNPQVKGWAQNILNEQKDEIGDLQMFIDNHKMSTMNNHDNTHDQLMMSAMKKMEEDMKMMKMYDDVDKHYVSMMIPHHQSAIDMAQMQLKHGGNAELKKMAQMMIEDQTKEIAAFNDWINKN